MSKRFFLFCAVLVAGWVVATQAAGPTFRPDMVFRGNSLTGWTPLGQADWRAENGEIVGTPKAPGGGWLVLNKSFEDVAVFSNVTCPAGCKAGVLVRAEKTADGGMKGVYVSLTESEPGSFAITLDAQGRETGRTQLQAGGRGGGGGGGRAGAGAPGAPGAAGPGGRRRARRGSRSGCAVPGCAGCRWARRERRRPAAVAAAVAWWWRRARHLLCRRVSAFPGWLDRPERFVRTRTARTSRWRPAA